MMHPLYDASLTAAKTIASHFREIGDVLEKLPAPYTRAVQPLHTEAAVGIYHDRIRREVVDATNAKPGGPSLAFRWLRFASRLTNDLRFGQLAEAAAAIRTRGDMSREAAVVWTGMSDRNVRREWGTGRVKGDAVYAWATSSRHPLEGRTAGSTRE